MHPFGHGCMQEEDEAGVRSPFGGGAEALCKEEGPEASHGPT